MRRRLEDAGFRPGLMLAVSTFRHPILKKLFPAAWLAQADRALQPTGRWVQLSPSIFVRSSAGPASAAAGQGAFFACPVCASPLADTAPEPLACPNPTCGRRWSATGRLYDFKQPL
jgi:hypothetical protein